MRTQAVSGPSSSIRSVASPAALVKRRPSRVVSAMPPPPRATVLLPTRTSSRKPNRRAFSRNCIVPVFTMSVSPSRVIRSARDGARRLTARPNSTTYSARDFGARPVRNVTASQRMLSSFQKPLTVNCAGVSLPSGPSNRTCAGSNNFPCGTGKPNRTGTPRRAMPSSSASSTVTRSRSTVAGCLLRGADANGSAGFARRSGYGPDIPRRTTSPERPRNSASPESSKCGFLPVPVSGMRTSIHPVLAWTVPSASSATRTTAVSPSRQSGAS